MYPSDSDPIKKERRLNGRGYRRDYDDNTEFRECREAIIRAFKKLRSQSIRTRANFMCCGSCACAAITNLDDERKKKGKKPYDGAVYWHHQSEQGLRESGGVCIYYCVDAKNENAAKAPATALANKLVAALKAEDLDVTWDGSTGSAVEVDGFTKVYWVKKGLVTA